MFKAQDVVRQLLFYFICSFAINTIDVNQAFLEKYKLVAKSNVHFRSFCTGVARFESFLLGSMSKSLSASPAVDSIKS